MFADPTFWVLIALIVFLGIVYRAGAFKSLGSFLSNHGEKISKELDEARELKEEAQALLADFKKKQSQAEKDAIDMVERAKEDAKRIREEAEASAKELIARRSKQAELKIAQAEKAALEEVSRKAADLAIETVRHLASDDLSAAKSKKLINDGLKEVNANLNA